MRCCASPSAARTTLAVTRAVTSPSVIRSRHPPAIDCAESALHSDTNTAPCLHAASTSALSNFARDNEAPAGRGTRAVLFPTVSSNSCRGLPPHWSTSPPRPAAPSRLKALPFRQQPHTLYLGKRALSMSKTLGPRRAISSAAIDPAGPAPTTTTSQDVSAMSGAARLGQGLIKAPLEQKAVRKSSLDVASAEPRVHREHPHFVDRERAFYGARSVVYAHVVAK